MSDLRSAIIRRKNANGDRAIWSSKGEAASLIACADIFSTVHDTINA